MRIESILAAKGREVVTVSPEHTVADAVGLLMAHRIGSLMVLHEGEIAGIVTERDVLRLTDEAPEVLGQTEVQAIMTRDPMVAEPNDDLHYVMAVMTRNRVRHLPVVRDGALVGIISIGDVVNALRRDAETENRHLRDYVQGLVR